MSSVNTNYGAMVALQNLNSTNKQLGEVQSRINTGLKVSSAKDNGAVFAIAQEQRVRVSSLGAIREGIDRANSQIDTAIAAGEGVGKILEEMKKKAVSAQTFTNRDDRLALQVDFDRLRSQIDSIANGATFNGVNLANGSQTAQGGINVMTSDKGSVNGTVSGYVGRGTVAGATTAAFANISLQTDITSQDMFGATELGVVAGEDYVTFTVDNTDNAVTPGTASDDTNYRLDIEAGMTLGDFINKVSEATEGRVKAQWDADTKQVVYTSSSRFAATVTDGTTTSDADADLTNLLGGNLNSATATNAYVAGGGFQLASAGVTTASAPPPSLASKVSTFAGTMSGDEVVTFNLAGPDESLAGAGDNRTITVRVGTDWTLGQFVDEVSKQSGGAIQATYDQSKNTVVYRANELFNVAQSGFATATGATLLGPAAAASAVKAPPSDGSTSGGSATTNVSAFDFRVGKGALATVTSTLNIADDATAAASAIDTAIKSLNSNLATMGSQGRALDMQNDFLMKLSDNLEKGVGIMVDADLAKESARLQSLQIRQQLGAQALSIANQQPQILLSFFR
jgi:flagellin